MYLQSLVSAFPEARFTQLESWEALVAENAMDHLSRRGRKIMETVLKGDSGSTPVISPSCRASSSVWTPRD